MPERKALPMLRRGWLLSAGLLSICAAALAALGLLLLPIFFEIHAAVVGSHQPRIYSSFVEAAVA